MREHDSDDLPESDALELAVPFVVCQSQGGPYEDDSFTAGFQCGEIDKALAVVKTAANSLSQRTTATWTVRAALVRQLELIAMHRGFPVMQAEAIEGMPEWSVVSFATSSPPRRAGAGDGDG